MPFFRVVGNRVDITSPEKTTQFKALHLSIQNLKKQVGLKTVFLKPIIVPIEVFLNSFYSHQKII
jgi:hypothetical protein